MHLLPEFFDERTLQGLDQWWSRQIDFHDEMRSRAQEESGKFALGNAGCWTCDFEKSAEELFKAIVKYAEKTFSPFGEFAIDQGPLSQRFLPFLSVPSYRRGHETWDPSTFKPSTLVDTLRNLYGGSQANEQLFRQAAEQILKETGLKHRPEKVKQQGKWTTIDVEMWEDSYFAQSGGAIKYSYSSSDKFRNMLDPMRTFLTQVEIPQETKDAVIKSFERICRYVVSDTFHSRDKLVDDAEAVITVFKNKVQLKFGPAISEKLRVFLGKYAQAA